MYVMDRFQLHSDPCDRRIIRLNNCVQIVSCVCNILRYVGAVFGRCSPLGPYPPRYVIWLVFFHAVEVCWCERLRVVPICLARV